MLGFVIQSIIRFMERKPENYFASQKESIKKDKIESGIFSFNDPEQHKSTRLKINKVNRVLGSGSYSRWVAEVNVELANDTATEKKTHNMVIKRYEEEGSDAVQDLRESYENFRALKKIDMSTWDTYRINEEHKLALMTLGVKENEILLTANDSDEINIDQFRGNPVKKIENLNEFVAKASLILEKANMYGYRLRADTYGAIFKPQPNNPGVYKLDIIISDLDSLDSSKDPHYIENYGNDIKERWREENKDNLSNALWCIFPGSRDEKEAFRESIMSKI